VKNYIIAAIQTYVYRITWYRCTIT